MPVIENLTKLNSNRYLVLTDDGGLYLSKAAPTGSSVPKLADIFNSSSQYDRLGTGITTYAVFDKSASSPVSVYAIAAGSASAFSRTVASNGAISPPKYFGGVDIAFKAAQKTTEYTLYGGLDDKGNLLTYKLTQSLSAATFQMTSAVLSTDLSPTLKPAGLLNDFSRLALFQDNSVSLPGYSLPTVSSNTTNKFDTLLYSPTKGLFLYSAVAGTGTNPPLNSNNAFFLKWDPASLPQVASYFATNAKTRAFLTTDGESNIHLILTTRDSTDAIGVQPLDWVFDKYGQQIAATSLDYSALNYVLDGVIGVGFTLEGQFSTATQDLQFSTLDENGSLFGTLSVISPNGMKTDYLSIAQVSYPTNSGSKSLGYVLTDATVDSISAKNSFYLGANINLADIKSKNPSIYVDADSTDLVIVWNEQATSDPLYLKSTKGSPIASVERLTTDKLLSLEQSMGVDLNNDQAIGTLGLIADPLASSATNYAWRIQMPATATTTTTVSLYKLSNGSFFTPRDPSFSAPKSGVLGLADLTGLVPVSASDLRMYESRQVTTANSVQKDLNGDGLIGTVVDRVIIAGDSFSLYKTTAGDVVYSARNGLTPGDLISDAVSIALSPTDQKNLEITQVPVSAIVTSPKAGGGVTNNLFIGMTFQDALSGLTVFREIQFTLAAPVGGSQSYIGPLTNDYSFNNKTEGRSSFLQRELIYNVDLNNDGVIGDTIVAQLSSNEQATVYQTASGRIYVSTQNALNISDEVDSSAIQLFDLSNTPDKIDTAVLAGGGRGIVFYSDTGRADVAGNPLPDIHYSRSFSSVNKALSWGAEVKLSSASTYQTEIQYRVDIDSDGQLGDTLYKDIYQTSASNDNTSKRAGLYALFEKIDPNLGVDPVDKLDVNNRVLIATKKTGLVLGDRQENINVVYLQNGQGVNPYWQLPIYNKAQSRVVAEGFFSSGIDVVMKDVTKTGSEDGYYLVTFDSSGRTNKPNGTLLSKYALYNEEIKLGVDFNGDKQIGDSVAKIAADDGYGIYLLNRSGNIVLSRESNWADGSDKKQWVQKSNEFIQLKTSNGSSWLPVGWKMKQSSNGTYLLDGSGNAGGKITQVAFNTDGTYNVYVMRSVASAQGATNVIYDIAFNATGVTRNATGTALSMSTLYGKELFTGIDINQDGFVGKPVLFLKTSTGTLPTDMALVSYGFDAYGFFSGNLISNASVPGLGLTSQTTTTSKYSSNAFTITAWGDGAFYSGHSPGLMVITDKSGKEISQINSATQQHPVGGGDFNKDGRGDFIAIDWTNNQIVVYGGNDKGQFAPIQRLSIEFERDEGNIKSTGVSVDIGNDGYSDFVLLDINSMKDQYFGRDILGVYRNSKGVLSLVDRIDLGPSAFKDIYADDINKDGFSDLLLISGKNDLIRIVYGNSNGFSSGGVLGNFQNLTGIYNPTQARVADINGDGLNDIIVLDQSATGKNQIEAFFGKLDGSFASPQTLISSDEVSQRLYGQQFNTFNVQDVNKDGLPEIVVQDRIFWNSSNLVGKGQILKLDLNADVYLREFESRAATLGLNIKLKALTGLKQYASDELGKAYAGVVGKWGLLAGSESATRSEIQINSIGSESAEYGSIFKVFTSSSDPVFMPNYYFTSNYNYLYYVPDVVFLGGTGSSKIMVTPNMKNSFSVGRDSAGNSDQLIFPNAGLIKVQGVLTYDYFGKKYVVEIAYKSDGKVTPIYLMLGADQVDKEKAQKIDSVGKLNDVVGGTVIQLSKNLVETSESLGPAVWDYVYSSQTNYESTAPNQIYRFNDSYYFGYKSSILDFSPGDKLDLSRLKGFTADGGHFFDEGDLSLSKAASIDGTSYTIDIQSNLGGTAPGVISLVGIPNEFADKISVVSDINKVFGSGTIMF